MFPPGEEDHMRDKLGTLPFDVGTTYPDQCNPLHVVQSSGETIFVPRYVANNHIIDRRVIKFVVCRQ